MSAGASDLGQILVRVTPDELAALLRKKAQTEPERAPWWTWAAEHVPQGPQVLTLAEAAATFGDVAAPRAARSVLGG